MKKLVSLIAIGVILALFSWRIGAAEASRIGVVNLTILFNDSSFVKKANTKLQDDVKEMETNIKSEQKNLQDLVSQYEKAGSNKDSLKTKITTQQNLLAMKTQEYQQKIRDTQTVGMQKFSDLVRIATEKVAKKQKLNAVLSSASLVYTDGSWVDITKDVAAEM